jgi:hypothetical protein
MATTAQNVDRTPGDLMAPAAVGREVVCVGARWQLGG